MRNEIIVSLFLVSLALPSPAHAQEKDQKEPAKEGSFDIGVLGGVGFPHPLAVEAVLGIRKTFMVGVEYGFFPTTTISSVDIRMWSAAFDARYFPFKGAFFIGLRTGYQSVSAETTLSAANVGSYTESVDVGTWFVNPRVGFLWTWKPFALGIDVGAQIPLGTTVTRSSLLAVAAPEVDASITRWTTTLGRTVLPTVDLLRMGVVF